MEQNPKKHIDSYLALANGLRFKLWAIVGKNESKKHNIIQYLTNTLKWSVIDVESQLSGMYKKLYQLEEPSSEVGLKLKEWFNSLPNNIILTNASILYHSSFTKISPVGAFKYNSRNKNCIIFLENEELLGNRLYYGKTGAEDYYDREINDIVITKFDEILEDYAPSALNEGAGSYQVKITNQDAIGKLFDFHEIKDVIDIDTDIKENDLQQELVSSYIISESLEQQIIDFYDNLKTPKHRAVKILGNYGSGKSHLIAFLVSTVLHPELRELISNTKVKEASKDVTRKYLSVQFELQAQHLDLSYIFFRRLESQLKSRYDIDIPKYSKEMVDFKEHLTKTIETIKSTDPSLGLLVVIDEVSDFLDTKPQHEMKRDFQFLRAIAQVCQSQDFLLVTSMQEDIYSSVRFKDIAAQAGRIDQRFQNITIHRETIQKVISQRIVPKSANQKADIEAKLKPYAEKIEDVSSKMNRYVELFPFTPFLLNLFDELPYFEKRGVIQFAQSEIKHKLNEPFPYFFTFDKIFDVMEYNPNIKNMEPIYDTVKVVNIIKQRISANLEEKLHKDAYKIIKGLAIYSLWSSGHSGATAKELAERLLILPQNKAFESQMQVSLIVKRIREATDGYYIKVVPDTKTGNDYFKFNPDIDGTDPDERIDNEISAIGSAEGELEAIIFEQIKNVLDLEYFKNQPNVFSDECIWQSVKAFRSGLIIFSKNGEDIGSLPETDYLINFISPYNKSEVKKFGKNQLNIYLDIPGLQNVEHLKRIAAIRSLMRKNVLTSIMVKKLSDEIEGTRAGGITRHGIKYKISRWVFTDAKAELNGSQISIKHELGKEYNNLSEIIDELKKKIFDEYFTYTYPEHPKYSQLLTSSNIFDSLTRILDELVDGNFKRITQNTKIFLSHLNLLNDNEDLDISDNNIAQFIYSTIADKKGKVVDIENELVVSLQQKPYGLEPQMVNFFLIILTILGRISLKAKGGDEMDIANIKDKFRSLSQFENIVYAIKKEDLSYDFASRLLNALGLNGNLILRESNRNEAFREYKLKVEEILKLNKIVEVLVSNLENRSVQFIDSAEVSSYFQQCQPIDWNILNITNHAKFEELEYLNKHLKIISDALDNLENLKIALQIYNTIIFDGIQYMNEALDIIEENPEFVPDKPIIDKLEEFCTDTKRIVKDFSKFIRPDERFPLEGKIKAFKEIYVKDFYYPVHENHIGKKVNWKPFDYFVNDPIYKQCLQLAKLNCNANAKICNQANTWNKIKELRCIQLDIEPLYKIPFHTSCNFLKEPRDYSKIKTEGKLISKKLSEIKNEYTKNAVAEIRKNAKQLQLIKISNTARQSIQKIVETGNMTEILDDGLILTINELFKDIKIIRIKKNEILNYLFKENELLTRDQFKETIINFENAVLGDETGNDIRIKFEE
jgi:ABC-type cobalamin/Fe3+-siderophores transport system ATPase subunit